MNKVRFHYGYPISIDIDTEKQVDVYIDQIPPAPVADGNLQIVILEESRKGDLFKFFVDQKNSNLYTHLLTFYEEILASNSKAQLFHFPNIWVMDYKSPNKTFSVSTVVGGKNVPGLEGHSMRHMLWHYRHLIEIPKRFYLSGTAKNAHKFVPWRNVSYKGELVLGASKEPLFDSMFHIAIENTSIKNYFSEKLLDCFRSHTVPIYYGCPNIGEYFNLEGIICAGNFVEIIHACNRLNENTYQQMYEAVEDNYNKALEWSNCWERLKQKIIELI
jgi:hypothetical protein